MSCTELAAVAATTLPDYEGRVVFVDAVTDSPSAKPILQRYPTQYIPTSIFIGPDGGIVDKVIGPLSEADLRERLDSLAARTE